MLMYLSLTKGETLKQENGSNSPKHTQPDKIYHTESGDIRHGQKHQSSRNNSLSDTNSHQSDSEHSQNEHVLGASSNLEQHEDETIENIEPIVLSQETEPVVIMQNMILGDGGFPIFPANMEGQFMFPPNIPRNLSVVLGNGGSNLIVGNSEEQLVMPSQQSTVVMQDGFGGFNGDEDKHSNDGDEVVETYKVMYVVEWCEEEETASDGEKSQTSCKIMELNDSHENIEDCISDISKPKSPTVEAIEDMVSESSRTKAMSPISEAMEDQVSEIVSSELGFELPPPDVVCGIRSDVSGDFLVFDGLLCSAFSN